MGKGNCCVNGEYEGLFYIDNDDLCVYTAKETIGTDEPVNELRRNIPYTDMENWEYDEISSDWWFEEIIADFKHNFIKAFPSFTSCDEWIGYRYNKHAILENSLFYITIEDNEWSLAVELTQKDDYITFQKKNYQKYLNGIKNALFLQFDTLGVYGGPWMHGTIHKETI